MKQSGSLYRHLETLDRDDFEHESCAVADALEAEASELDAVEQIVAFMESHPEIDFGPPGPLSHFIESFHGKGYDEVLISSVEKQPTQHTLWLLHRLINGEPAGPRRDMLKALHTVAEKRVG